jgi:hypothetical protein
LDGGTGMNIEPGLVTILVIVVLILLAVYLVRKM